MGRGAREDFESDEGYVMKKVGKLEGWQVEKITEAFALRPPKKEARELLRETDLVSFLPMEDLEVFQRDIVTTKERRLKEVSGSYTYFANNDVLLAKITPCFENGKLGIARNLKNGIGFGSSEYIVFRPQGKVIPEYLFYYLARDEFRRDGEKAMTGTAGQKRIPPSFIGTQDIVYPALSEQQRIVAVLDEAFASIAQAKANAERNLVNARELFESAVQEIFSRGAGLWEERRMNEISKNLDSQRIPVTKRDRKKGEYPYYGASGIVDHVSKFIFDADLLLVSEDGANLLARTYPIAFSIDGKVWVNNHAHVLRFEKMATQKLVEYYLNSIPLDEYVNGMAQPKLNQAALNSIVIPFPPLAEQRAIVQRLEALSAETKRLEAIYRQKLRALEELKKAMLAKAFSGEL